MLKPEQLQYVGSMQQLAYVRQVRVEEGRADGMRMVEVENGKLHFEIMADKCLDIASLRVNGENRSFLAKNGLQGLSSYDVDGTEAQRSIMGGLFFTCGPDNVGPPQNENGRNRPMHGRFRVTPAEHLSCDAFWKQGEYILQVSGEMRVAELFGENIVLRRTIQTKLNSRDIHIHDEIVNEGFAPVPLMLLYHVNIGYPLLQKGAEIIIPSERVAARDLAGQNGLNQWNIMPAPRPREPEQVFYHEGLPERLRIGVRNKAGNALWLQYKREELPVLTQWKSSASGDYVVGLEPGNCHVEGVIRERKRGELNILEPFDSKTIDLTITAE